jgi:hypothetical protein
MADRFIGLNRAQGGFTPSEFTVGTSTGSTDMELRYSDAASLTRLDIIKFLEACERYLESNILQGGVAPDL